MNCILHNVFSIKDCVTAVVIDGVVLGRFLSLDCFVFVYKNVHVLRRKCFIVYKGVVMYSFADVWKYVSVLVRVE